MGSNRTPTLTAAKVACVYALVSGAYILFSDMLVAAAAPDVEALTRVQTVKGWAFVLATSLLLFFMMRREMRLFFKADEAQRASDSNFRVLVENAPEPIFIQAGSRFAYVNAAATALFGAGNSAELVGKPVMDRYHPDFHDIIRERIRRVNTERRPAPAIEQVFVQNGRQPRDGRGQLRPLRVWGGERGAGLRPRHHRTQDRRGGVAPLRAAGRKQPRHHPVHPARRRPDPGSQPGRDRGLRVESRGAAHAQGAGPARVRHRRPRPGADGQGGRRRHPLRDRPPAQGRHHLPDRDQFARDHHPRGAHPDQHRPGHHGAQALGRRAAGERVAV